MTVGQRIKEARKRAKLTQKELAGKLGLACPTIAQWERGLRNPKLETLQKIADVLGIDVLELIQLKPTANNSGSEKDGPPVLTIQIDSEILNATVEAARELKERYEAEAAALARLDTPEAKELAQERLNAANVAKGLFNYYTNF